MEGEISKDSIMSGLSQGKRASGDLIPWTISQQVCGSAHWPHPLSISQFVDHDFPSLSGARIVRIASHPDIQGVHPPSLSSSLPPSLPPSLSPSLPLFVPSLLSFSTCIHTIDLYFSLSFLLSLSLSLSLTLSPRWVMVHMLYSYWLIIIMGSSLVLLKVLMKVHILRLILQLKWVHWVLCSYIVSLLLFVQYNFCSLSYAMVWEFFLQLFSTLDICLEF